MQITVLGCFGPYPPAGGCCSGYLVRENKTAVLLDCGNGVLSRLRYYLEPWELAAVVVSHLHSDHTADLLILRYAMQYYLQRQQGEGLPVFAPAEPEEEFARLSYKEYLQARAVQAGETLRVGELEFSFAQAVHAVPAYIITVRSGKQKFVYSGDTEYCPQLMEAAAGADLFLCEANYLRSDLESGGKNHLAAFQAAGTARAAGVKRLVLTHHHPERNPKDALQEAGAIFPRVELAYPGSSYEL
ncbi:MAG: MBL fold metallo-hydrolase [Firmicutes bacterium]|jgi:ribonuclease BN (tRNA processing enzyme)|nr:MBL fold metallo-hydrolase [Bacillota bacterium]